MGKGLGGGGNDALLHYQYKYVRRNENHTASQFIRKRSCIRKGGECSPIVTDYFYFGETDEIQSRPEEERLTPGKRVFIAPSRHLTRIKVR